MTKANYIEGGDTAQKKCILEGGDTAHTFLIRETIGVGTPYNIVRKRLAVGGWVKMPLLIWEVAYQVGGGPS